MELKYWKFRYYDGHDLVKIEIIKTTQAFCGAIESNHDYDIVVELVYGEIKC